jgi:ketosteroid isomerase-like protein
MDMTLQATRPAALLVAALFEVVDGRLWADLDTVFAEDCVYHRPGYEPLVGLARIRRFYQEERIIASGRHQVVGVLGEGGSMACWGRFQGLSHSGQAIDEGFADAYRVQAGRITDRRTYFYRAAI